MTGQTTRRLGGVRTRRVQDGGWCPFSRATQQTNPQSGIKGQGVPEKEGQRSRRPGPQESGRRGVQRRRKRPVPSNPVKF